MKQKISYIPIAIIAIIVVAAIGILSINEINKNTAGQAILASLPKFASGESALLEKDLGDLEYNGFNLGIVLDTDSCDSNGKILNEFSRGPVNASKTIDVSQISGGNPDLIPSLKVVGGFRDSCNYDNSAVFEVICAKDIPTDVIRSGTGQLPTYDPAIHGDLLLAFSKDCPGGCQDGVCLPPEVCTPTPTDCSNPAIYPDVCAQTADTNDNCGNPVTCTRNTDGGACGINGAVGTCQSGSCVALPPPCTPYNCNDPLIYPNECSQGPIADGCGGTCTRTTEGNSCNAGAGTCQVGSCVSSPPAEPVLTEMGPLLSSNMHIPWMTEYNGDLYAIGYRNIGGINSAILHRYDGGSTWTSIGSVGDSGVSNFVYGFTVYDGKIYMVTNAKKMYTYDGVSITQVAPNLPPSMTVISSLAVFNDGSGDKLYVGGMSSVPTVYRLDGSVWTNTGSFNIYYFNAYQGSLYGGSAQNHGGNIYKYDGGTSWSSATSFPAADYVATTSMINGGGNMFIANDGQGVYSFDGTTWTSLGKAITGGTPSSKLAYYNGKLYAGGGLYLKYHSSGTSWTAVSGGGLIRVTSMFVFNDGSGDKLFIGTQDGRIFTVTA